MRPIPWFRSVTFKFTASIIVTAILVTWAAAHINIRMRRDDYAQDAGTWAYHLSETIKNATRHSMMVNRSYEIQTAIDSIATQKMIDKIRVFDSQGRIAISSAPEEIGRQLGKESPTCIRCHSSEQPFSRLPRPEAPEILTSADGSRRLLSSVLPILNEPNCSNAECHAHPTSQKILGVLDVTLDLHELGERIVTGTSRLILLSLISILSLSLFFILLTRFKIVRPLRLLLEGTERVTQGNFEHSIPVQSRDELGALSQAFNRMTTELSSHVSDLRRWVVTLEDKVKERTQELETTRMQLVQQEKMASLGRLAAGVAHEINNPLTSILVFSSILRDKTPEDHFDAKKIKTIVTETIRCREIVDRLLAFSRQDEPRKEDRQINEVIESTFDLLKNQSLFQNIDVRLQLGKNLPLVSIDPNQIQQVFFNIMVNAADAMPEGGTLTIRSHHAPYSSDSDYVICEVEDTGKGIAPEDIPRLFDPFFTTKEKGTGLGLSICHGIIRRHEGSIEVKSNKGKGSIFRIQLPLGSRKPG